MDIPFLQAKYFNPLTSPRTVDLVVIHAAEVNPSPGQAAWLMNYCANNDRVASWHYAVDSDAVTQSVKENDVAYHAPGANARGIGLELATAKEPTADQWADPYHQKMLTLAAWLTAGICARFKIDPFFVDAHGLLELRRGVTLHAEVSKAYPAKASAPPHMDPGPFFPMDVFLAKVKARLDAGNFQAEV